MQKKKLSILVFLIFLTSGAMAAGLIENGSFETTSGGKPTGWDVGVCGSFIESHWSCDDGTFPDGWISTEFFHSDGTKAVSCDTSCSSGTTAFQNRTSKACIVSTSSGLKDCSSNNTALFRTAADTNSSYSITLTRNYGDDFNIQIEVQDTDFYTYYRQQYASSSTLSTGTIITFDARTDVANCSENGGASQRCIQIDNVRASGHTNTVTESADPVLQGENFSIKATVTDFNGSNIINADANLYINNTIYPMVYTNGFYTATLNLNATNVYDYNVLTRWESADTNTAGNITVLRAEYQFLEFTPIQNVANWGYGSINVYPGSVAPDIETIFKVDSNSGSTELATFNIYNQDETGRQYFIYTSSDGEHFAFDDTLTFGSTTSNPIQKIWEQNNLRFKYTFIDTLTALETKYYKLSFKQPYWRTETITNSDEWIKINSPELITDVNRLDFDRYSITQFAGLRNLFKQYIPDISGDESVAFELQFTARADVNATLIEVGESYNSTDNGKSSAQLTTEWHRYSFGINASNFDSQILIIATPGTPVTIEITDYAIIPRGYFTKRMDLRKANGDFLDLFLLNGISSQYLQEGNPFRITTGAYDREGLLTTLQIIGYFDAVVDTNTVKKTTIDIYGNDVPHEAKIEKNLDFSQSYPGIVDLNGTAANPNTPRNLFVQAKLIDENGFTVAVQTRMIKFLQYPYFPDDLMLNFFPTEKRRGKNPAGILEINIKRPEILEGFDIRVYSDTNTFSAPNYQTRIFNKTNFLCDKIYCSLQIKMDEYLFEDTNKTTISIIALTNTEYFTTDNNLTRLDRYVFVTPITFETLKIHQVVERADRTYRRDEEIPLVLVVRDTEADSLKDALDIYITLQNCDAASAGNCVAQTIRYKPTGFIYDPKFNYNYYFFRHLYVLDNGNLLPDTNYIGFRATITDKTGIRTTTIAALADKCANQDTNGSNFFPAALGFLLNFGSVLNNPLVTGCNTPQFATVTTTSNSAQEVRILIDEDHSVNAPSQEMFGCIAPDQNNVLDKPLEQDLICVSWYEVSEKPIDDFRLRITNQYSDVSIDGIEKQYIEFNVPYEVIAANDVQLLKEELETNQNTSIDTVGEFLYEGLRSAAGSVLTYSGITNQSDFLLQKGFISNIGADFNLNQAFSATTISGIVFYRIKGVPVINAYDYSQEDKIKQSYSDLDKKAFVRTLQENDISIRKSTARMDVFGWDFVTPLILEDSGVIVVDEKPTKQTINTSNLDVNANRNFRVIPNKLIFNLDNTMFFNNFSQNETRSISLTIPVIIKENLPDSALQFIEEVSHDPFAALEKFLKNNLLAIMAISLLLVVGGVIYTLWLRRA